MSDYELIKTALKIAEKAHEGQLDKGGKDYIFHPITVALLCEKPQEKAVALLHDTIEDTDVSYEEIRDKLGAEIADAVKVLTYTGPIAQGGNYESYFEYIKGIKESGNELAIAVKKADLTMNMDMSRIKNPTERDLNRIEAKYHPACDIIGLEY